MTAHVSLSRLASAPTAARLTIDLVVPRHDLWRWHVELARRLRDKGHDVQLVEGQTAGRPSLVARLILSANALVWRMRGILSANAVAVLSPPRTNADLRIELGASSREVTGVRTLTLAFNGASSPLTALRILAEGKLPTVETLLDGVRIGRALPMVNRRSLIGRGFDDVLARALTLVEKTITSIASGEMPPSLDSAEQDQPKHTLLMAYLTSTLPRLAGELLRLATHRHAHWRVGYRLHNDARPPIDGQLGDGWRELPDNGDHFYADPFAYEHEGRRHVFVEDFCHRGRRACISAFEVHDDGSATVPRPVLIEPHHLSYPNVFERDGAIWMIPESSSARELVLYRAERFPDVWVRHAVLVAGKEICDATLLDHNGRLYLFSTERDGFGSTSDVMVVYSADRLEGPWSPHPQNPIQIDRSAARPGGAFIHRGNELFLPVQDGTQCYGGGLGIAQLRQLDPQRVEFAPPIPVTTEAWPHPLIHTYNSSARLEVIDGLAPAPRWPKGFRR